MKIGPARTAIRTGLTICLLGIGCYSVAFAILKVSGSLGGALPFAAIGFFLSMPCVILAGDPFDKPPLFMALIPVTLVLNSVLISGIVWAFLRIKMVTDRKVYGNGQSQQSAPLPPAPQTGPSEGAR